MTIMDEKTQTAVIKALREAHIMLRGAERALQQTDDDDLAAILPWPELEDAIQQARDALILVDQAGIRE